MLALQCRIDNNAKITFTKKSLEFFKLDSEVRGQCSGVKVHIFTPNDKKKHFLNPVVKGQRSV